MRKLQLTAGSLLAVALWVPVAGAQRIAVPGPPPQATPPEVSSRPSGANPAAGEAPAGGSATAQGSSARQPEESIPLPERGKRRDPFHTLIPERKPGAAAPVHYPAGKKGLVIEQLDLKGIARAVDGTWIAVVDNKAKRAYFLHDKDQLYDGVVSKILPDRVIFLVSPAEKSTSSQGAPREVVKSLPPE